MSKIGRELARLREENQRLKAKPRRTSAPNQIGPGGAFVQFQHETHSGPLPHPDTLSKYNQAFPGCAEKIVAMAVSQSDHRQRIETIVVRGNNAREWVGQAMAFVLCAGGMFLGYQLLARGIDIAGYAALMVSLATPIGLFILKRQGERKEVERKRRLASGE